MPSEVRLRAGQEKLRGFLTRYRYHKSPRGIADLGSIVAHLVSKGCLKFVKCLNDSRRSKFECELASAPENRGPYPFVPHPGWPHDFEGFAVNLLERRKSKREGDIESVVAAIDVPVMSQRNQYGDANSDRALI